MGDYSRSFNCRDFNGYFVIYLLFISKKKFSFQIDKNNKMLIKGFNQSYEYERKQVTGRATYKDFPCKSRESHPHDALQYLCIFAHPDYEQLKKHTEFVTQTNVRTLSRDITNYG